MFLRSLIPNYRVSNWSGLWFFQKSEWGTNLLRNKGIMNSKRLFFNFFFTFYALDRVIRTNLTRKTKKIFISEKRISQRAINRLFDKYILDHLYFPTIEENMPSFFKLILTKIINQKLATEVNYIQFISSRHR